MAPMLHLRGSHTEGTQNWYVHEGSPFLAVAHVAVGPSQGSPMFRLSVGWQGISFISAATRYACGARNNISPTSPPKGAM